MINCSTTSELIIFQTLSSLKYKYQEASSNTNCKVFEYFTANWEATR